MPRLPWFYEWECRKCGAGDHDLPDRPDPWCQQCGSGDMWMIGWDRPRDRLLTHGDTADG